MKTFVSAILLFGAFVPAGVASTFPPLERRSVLEAVLPAANPPMRLLPGARIRFAPGQPTGLHVHPASTNASSTESAALLVFDLTDTEDRPLIHVSGDR